MGGNPSKPPILARIFLWLFSLLAGAFGLIALLSFGESVINGWELNLGSFSIVRAYGWMIPGALVGYIAARIYKRDTWLCAAIGAVAFFAMNFIFCIEDKHGPVMRFDAWFPPEMKSPMEKYKDRGFGD